MLDILSVCVCVSIALFRCEAESGSKLLLGVRSEPKKTIRQNEMVDHCQHIFQSILWFLETQNKETCDCVSLRELTENCVMTLMSRRAFSHL